MAVKSTEPPGPQAEYPQGAKEIPTAISVVGYKSLVDKQRMEIRPLTVLGVNSGGKSSITSRQSCF